MNANQPFNPWLASSDSPQGIGLDIGGANLKIADGRGRTVSLSYALWRGPQGLSAAIASLIADFGTPSDSHFALTMTGELADCYATKADGVRAIVDATLDAAAGRVIRVAAVDDSWLTPEEAKEQTHLVAAANWRLGARLASRANPIGRGVWVEVTNRPDVGVAPINLRAAAQTLKLTAYYRPEDASLDLRELDAGNVRFCGTNTGQDAPASSANGA